MNDLAQAALPTQDPSAAPVNRSRARFFRSPDWLSFAITFLLALAVYLYTLAPEETLDFSGIFAAGAMYGGVPHPPGFVAWTLYGWLITNLLPFGNAAWRLGVASGLAGALACGVVALTVSRGASLLLENVATPNRLPARQQQLLCAFCGSVAALGLALDVPFWRNAVIVETWTLSLFLFALALCLLLQWSCAPERRSRLYAAALAYGLLLTNNQSLAVAAIGFIFLVLFAHPPLGRDLLFGITGLLATELLARAFGQLPDTVESLARGSSLWTVYLVLCIVSAVVSAVVAYKTRGLLTELKPALTTALFLLLGLSLYFYVPIASMTNPPMNWGYAREVNGFIHTLSRGQYERLHATDSLIEFAVQMKMYFIEVMKDFGLIYLVPAIIPFLVLRRLRGPVRAWLFGLLVLYLCASFFLVAMLNISIDRQSLDIVKDYFSASHLILAICAGHGLVLIGAWVSAKLEQPH